MKMWELNDLVECALSLILVVLATEPVSSAHITFIPGDTLNLLQLFQKMTIFLLCFKNPVITLNFIFNI